MYHKLTFAFIAAVLLVGLGVMFWGVRLDMTPKFNGHVADLVPAQTGLPGWQVKDAPVAETPEIQRQVDQLLDFTEAVYRIYEKGGMRVSVYLAYWKPGKMPVKEIARHTPDVCWTAGGWQKRSQSVFIPPVVDGQAMEPAEWRAFSMHGQTEHVVFWHLVDGKAHSYHTGGRPAWNAVITDTIARGIRQKPEQFFLRISSNQPLEEFWTTEVVQKVVGAVPWVKHTRE